MREPSREEIEMMRINPNPRVVALLDYAIDKVTEHLFRKPEYTEWFGWADSWKAGRRSPQACVDIAHFCFSHKGWGMDGKGTDPVWHTLGQLAWGGKEACYSHPTGAWLVIRYIADAMTAFGIAFPDDGIALLGPPTIDIEPDAMLKQISR
jgi:hypothetical protein